MLTLHHLQASRSSRVIWLLEALGAKYNLVTHKRGPDLRAGADLKEVHPLGKAPALVDGDLTLVESATILRYVSERHGQGRFMPPANTNARAIHDERLDYIESSLMSPAMIKLMGRGALPEHLDQFASRELDRALSYLSDGFGDGPFLMGADGDACGHANVLHFGCPRNGRLAARQTQAQRLLGPHSGASWISPHDRSWRAAVAVGGALDASAIRGKNRRLLRRTIPVAPTRRSDRRAASWSSARY